MAIADGKMVLAYPVELGSTAKDGSGAEAQYMIITIVTDEKASRLKGDEKFSDVFTTASTSRTTGFGTAGSVVVSDKNTDPEVSKLFGQAAVDKADFVKQKGVIKLNKAIVLPMPNDLVVPTSVSYSEVPATFLSKGAEFLESNQKLNTIKDYGRLVKNNTIAAVVNALKSDATNQRALLAEERIALNPRKEVLFDDFGFRKFSFRYTFAPRSQKESETVNQIIQTLRFYSLPELSEGKIFYLFPAEFNINFMSGQEINGNIPRIAPCALERVSVNYAPNGTWATLPNAAPVQIDMSLDFLELELIDRSRVFKEGSPISSGF